MNDMMFNLFEVNSYTGFKMKKTTGYILKDSIVHHINFIYSFLFIVSSVLTLCVGNV